MTENAVNKALDEARSFLSNQAQWINDSSLHLRAFYLGLYVGVGELGSDSDRQRILLEMVHQTMFARAGDDLFGSSALGAKLRAIREHLYRSLEASRGGKSSLDADDLLAFRDLALCIEQLDEKFRFHRNLAQAELEKVRSESDSVQAALRVLEALESSFRESFRLLTERPHTSGGS